MMENDFFEDGFEQMLKEKADQFSMYPSRRVWHSIYNNLHPGRRWPSVVISLLLISSLLLIGYLNTGENSITRQINRSTANQPAFSADNEFIPSDKKHQANQAVASLPPVNDVAAQQNAEPVYNSAFADVIRNMSDQFNYTVVKSNRPASVTISATEQLNTAPGASSVAENGNNHDIIQTVDTYIKSNQIFADIAAKNRKLETEAAKKTATSSVNNSSTENSPATLAMQTESAAQSGSDAVKQADKDEKKASPSKEAASNQAAEKNEERAWVENYALQNKAAAKKWKGKLGYQVYVTPAVNYRKLTTNSKGSAAPFATTGDINNSISQKPGFGFEAGFAINYMAAKKVQLKAGVQFNYTNYNIAAAETNHPISTSILLNDPSTGYSYSAARISTTSNSFNSTALQPVTLHNRTYQISLPVGFAYRISSQRNVDWYAGGTVQPSYVFDGKAHIISSDLKNYVSDRSSISPWNVSLGFETYMNFKLGSYNLQVGPQVRYQVNSTYKKDIALIEKPYAVGLKFGLTKGF